MYFLKPVLISGLFVVSIFLFMFYQISFMELNIVMSIIFTIAISSILIMQAYLLICVYMQRKVLKKSEELGYDFSEFWFKWFNEEKGNPEIIPLVNFLQFIKLFLHINNTLTMIDEYEYKLLYE